MKNILTFGFGLAINELLSTVYAANFSLPLTQNTRATSTLKAPRRDSQHIFRHDSDTNLEAHFVNLPIAVSPFTRRSTEKIVVADYLPV